MSPSPTSRHTAPLLIALALTGLLILAAAASGASSTSAGPAEIDAELLDEAQVSADVEFLVLFDNRADLSAAAALPSKEAKGRYVYDTLRHVALTSQANVSQMLTAQGVDYRPYWVNNMIWVRGDLALIEQLSRQPEVSAIRANPAVQLDLLPEAAPRRQLSTTKDEVLWNLAMVNAPAVWSQGYEGQGIVVGGQDTGYDWTHPALQPHYRGWNGATADHNMNWHDAIHSAIPGNPCGSNATEPCDDNYHGTHTMGTMVGDDGQGKRTGMAPQAQWIGCRNMDEGVGTPATYAECFEWFIAPYPLGGDALTDGDPNWAPDVINNSWSCPPSEGCTADILEPVVEAVRAAGIVTVQSAGNSGPSCASVNTPAALYDASLTVGAVSSSGAIAGFSSRGPVAASGFSKPDIVAPGVNIESTIPGDGYGELSGTSMSSPHVAGLVALLLSANPSLSGNVDAIEAVITQAAGAILTNQGCGGDAADAVPNNVFGWGLIDAEKAITTLIPSATPSPTPSGSPTATPLPSPTIDPSQPTATATAVPSMPYRLNLALVLN